MHTKLTIVGQIAFHGAMHKMLKGAYNSGQYNVHVHVLDYLDMTIDSRVNN